MLWMTNPPPKRRWRTTRTTSAQPVVNGPARDDGLPSVPTVGAASIRGDNRVKTANNATPNDA